MIQWNHQTFSISSYWGTNSSVVKCLPLNQKVGCSVHGHWVNCRSAPLARAFTLAASTRIKIQALACHQLLSPKLTTKSSCFYQQNSLLERKSSCCFNFESLLAFILFWKWFFFKGRFSSYRVTQKDAYPYFVR